MNNIEKVELMIEEGKEYFEAYGEYFITQEELIATENLIKAYKELEEENKCKTDYRQKYIELTNLYLAENLNEKDISAIQIHAIKQQGYIEGYAERDKIAREICEDCIKVEKYRNYIPKYSIKEKIEELKEDRKSIEKDLEEAKKEKNKEYYADLLRFFNVNYGAIQILQELLGEEK